jgi:hypothetical protein
MSRFSNRPFFATTLSLLSSRAKRADLRCAIRVPRSYRPTTSTNHHRVIMETPTSPLSFRVSRSGPRNRRSLHGKPGQVGFAPPDFLLRLVALANFMRLSLPERRTRNRVQRSVAGNPGRDDKERAAVHKEWLLNRDISISIPESGPCSNSFRPSLRDSIR